MNRFCKAALLSLAVLALTCCKKEVFEEGGNQKNVMSFTIGNDATASKASGSCGETQVASYALEGVEDNDLVLVETVSSVDNIYSGDFAETKGTPIYTKNFDSKYSEQVYATAYVPVTASQKSELTDVWGSYLENGGTVKLTKTDDANTYSYDYSKGQKVNLSWPESGKLLYFIQAPYETTNALNPKFYSDGSIEFDYTDPTARTTVGGRPTIVNGASAQKDILFTSKTISKPADGSLEGNNDILMFHALTAVKFKLGNEDMEVTTKITKVTFKSIKANGHCIISPDYTKKSSECNDWSKKHSKDAELVVDYSQAFNGTVNYTAASQFGEGFYANDSNLKNLGSTTDGSEILLMVPQTLTNVEVVVDFTINDKPFSRSVKISGDWKAGELHTYTLTVNKVDVEISDQMNEALTEKTGVTMKNSGNVTAYLRATYALAWYYGYDDDAICVAAYQGNGEFVYLGGPNDKDSYKLTWIKGSDGFYYYTWPVMPGRNPRFPFFDKFTAPVVSEKGPFPGAHLEMNILLQAVQYDESKEMVTAAWDNVYTLDSEGKPTTTKIVDVLSTEIENIAR